MTKLSIGVIEAIGSALGTTLGLIEGTKEDQWHVPTPCEGWDCLTVAQHLVAGVHSFTAIGEHQDPPTASPEIAPAGLARAYGSAADHALELWSAPGRLDGSYTAPWGEISGHVATGFLLIETVLHGWDIAQATGQPADFDPGVIDLADRGCRENMDDSARVSGIFGPEQHASPDATTLDALAAFTGRRLS